MANEAVLEVSGLSKTYGAGKTQTLALSRLDLRVNRGEIFGYLGPNGAGKTTTISLAAGSHSPERRLRADIRLGFAGGQR